MVEGFTDATCSFSTTTVGQTVSSVTWSHNVTRAVTDSGRISVTTNIAEGRSDLQINNVEFTDAGEYLCTVQFRNPSLQSTHSASLQVASEGALFSFCAACFSLQQAWKNISLRYIII